MSESSKTGVLLVNLGTPDEPTAKGVKRFLEEFLHDHRVVDMTRWIWCPVLHGIILPIRSPKVAKAYQSVWMDEGSPLMVYSMRQAAKLEQELGLPKHENLSMWDRRRPCKAKAWEQKEKAQKE